VNWKQKAQELSDRLEIAERLKREAEQTQSDKERQFRTEQVARAMKIASLDSQVQVLQRSVQEMTSQLQQSNEDKENYQNRLREAENRIAKLDQDIDQLSKSNADYLNKIAEAKNQVVALTNQKYNLQNQLQQFQERESQLAEQNAKLTKAVMIHEIDPEAPTADIAPRLDGRIVQVDRDLNLVIVNLGLDDGLRVGHTIDIQREGKYVGSAEVVATENNRASARLIREMMQKIAMQGDHVTTKF
jgi:DNA repair ATPase RecN